MNAADLTKENPEYPAMQGPASGEWLTPMLAQGILRPCAASQSAYQSSRSSTMASACAADCRRSSLFVPMTGKRLTRVRENPRVGELFQRCRVVTGRHVLRSRSQTEGGGIGWVKDSPTCERTPRHRLHAKFLALMQCAVVDWLRVQQVKLDLVRHERLFHPRVQQIKLRGTVVGYARCANLAGAHQLIQSRCRVVGSRQPVGAMDEKQFDMVGAEQSQGFFEALEETRASGVVMCRAAFGMVRTRHINTGLRDELELITQSRRQGKRLTELLLHFVVAVNLRGINGRDAEIDAGMEPAVDFLWGRPRLEQPPRAINHPREFRAMGRKLDSFHDLFAGLNDLAETCCDYNPHGQLGVSTTSWLAPAARRHAAISVSPLPSSTTPPRRPRVG